MWTVRAYDFPYVVEGQDFAETSRRLVKRIVRGVSGPRVVDYRIIDDEITKPSGEPSP